MNRSGFTLLEVVISVTILAFVSVFTAQSLRRSSQYKGKLQKDVDQRAQVRSALRLMERDLTLAFHYRGESWRIVAAMQGMIAQAQQQQQNPGAAPQPPNPQTQPPGGTGQPAAPQGPTPMPLPPYPRPTQFLGLEDKVTFASLSNFRTIVDSPVSDQLWVSYRMDNCPDRPIAIGGKKREGRCLIRKTSNWIYDEENNGNHIETVILDGLERLRFRYYGIGRDEWLTTWRTDNGTDALSQGRFPEAVEISVVTKKNGKELTLTTVAHLRFSNNPVGVDPANPGLNNGSPPANLPTGGTFGR